MKEFLLAFVLLCACGFLQGNPRQAATPRKTGYGPGEQEYGFVSLYPGADMFYWLFYTQAKVSSYYDRPLVIWLQGGPGASSSGYGNFAEIGPLHINGSARTASWVNYVNLMFIDNPLGAGFSNVDDVNKIPLTNAQIANDMVLFLTNFYQQYPSFSSTPLYIFCESYGGKMVAEIASRLDTAIKNQELDVDFRGVGLGDSWISPIDSVLTWAPFLLQASVIDQASHDRIQAAAQKIQTALDNNQFELATDLWGSLEGLIIEEAGNVDFYNILYKVPYGFRQRRKHETAKDFLYRNHVTRDDDADIQKLMEGPVKEALGIPKNVVHGAQSGYVFSRLYEDFMKPVTTVVEQLLNTTSLEVAVYGGQLDLIVDTPGTIAWVDRLNWRFASQWKTAERVPLVVNGYIEGYVKTYQRLSFYWIDRAGHMVPTDNPDATIELLRRVTQFDKKK